MWKLPMPVVAGRQLGICFPKILKKTSVNSKFASMFRNARRTEAAQRSMRVNLLFVRN